MDLASSIELDRKKRLRSTIDFDEKLNSNY